MNCQSGKSNFLTIQIKAICLICFMGLIAFSGTLHSPFHYDDEHAIVENPHIKDLSKFQEKVGIQNIFNRSVLLLSFAINQHFGEFEVFGYHLVNILIHILTSILWFFLIKEFLLIESIKKISFKKNLPLICSSIHLLNPLNIQAVTYISSRSSLLATFFYVLAFYILVHIKKPIKGIISKVNFLILVFFFLIILFLGFATKEIVASFPLMAIVYIWLSTAKQNRKSLVPQIASILFILIGFLAYRYLQQGNLFSLKADPTSEETHRLLYLLSQIRVVVGYYFLKLLAPFSLNFEPDIILYKSWFHWDWFISLLVLLSAGVAVFKQNSILIKFGAAWLCITLLPTSSFIPLKQLATEHRAYLPSLGFSLILGCIFLNIKIQRFMPQILFIIFLLLISLLTLNRSLDFRSEISLWEDTSKKSPHKALVQNNLATAYMGANQLEKAKVALNKALSINPLQIESHVNLGHIASRKKNWKVAIEKFDLGIALGTKRADTFYYSGFARNILGKYEEAIPYFKNAITIKPFNADYHFDLGNSYQKLNQFDDALFHFRKALQINPNYYKAHNNIGTIFWSIGELDKAKFEFEKVLHINPNIPTIQNNLASIYLKKGEFKKAIPHLEALINLQPKNVNAKKLLQFSLEQLK
ncbi:MAG: tetratricopeptide repeat protein [Nitrospinota bacterium]|nr:tetratricopeptide repeat protein [Nitrospinota bacterium]